MQSLGTSEDIRFQRAGAEIGVPSPLEVRTPLGRVPGWFVHLLEIPEVGASYPVTIEGKRVGDIVFAPDMSADIYEKWIGFLAIAASGIALMLLTGVIAHFTARSALGPLQNLGDGLTRMRMGDYEHLIPATGPSGDTQEFAGSQRTRAHAQAPQPGQSKPAAPDRVAAGRRTPRYGARTA